VTATRSLVSPVCAALSRALKNWRTTPRTSSSRDRDGDGDGDGADGPPSENVPCATGGTDDLGAFTEEHPAAKTKSTAPRRTEPDRADQRPREIHMAAILGGTSYPTRVIHCPLDDTQPLSPFGHSAPMYALEPPLTS